MARKQNVVRMHHGLNLNIGIVIFVIIIIYVIFNLISYLTSSPVAEYEVGQGTIATNHVYHGLILRDETVVYAGQSGYINYYLKNGTKASVNDVVYSIDTSGELSRQISDAASTGDTLDPETLKEVSSDLEVFRNSYDSNTFSSVYTFKNELNAQLTQTLSMNALSSLNEDVKTAVENNTFYKKKSEKPGIIVYYTDGYESVTTDNFTSGQFNMADYKRNSLDDQEQVTANTPAYKRIDSEKWNILLPVSEDMAKQLKDNEYIKIRFCKDDFTLTVPYSLTKKDGSYYVNLSLKTAMIRYVNDRFVDVELVVSEKTGLKIPNSAITKKQFYTVPKEYFTQGGDSSDPGLMIENHAGDTGSVTLVQPTIYYETDDFYYIDDETVSAGDVVVKNNSSGTYTIGSDVDKLTGVYNINKGYAVFKQIDILAQNNKYTIVDTGTSYGVALYDHIALDGSKIKENQLVVK